MSEAHKSEAREREIVTSLDERKLLLEERKTDLDYELRKVELDIKWDFMYSLKFASLARAILR